MPSADFFGFLRCSLSVLEKEVSEAHSALAAALGDLRARLVADGVACSIWRDSSGWRIYPGPTDADLEVAFDRRVILDLIDGRMRIHDAIDRERLRLRGPVEAIERFYGALMIYLEGLMRAPGAMAILKDYREE
jgi:hypothetical protein